MPIELITGLPGNAKTLHALQTLIKRAKDEQRPVYYDGLKEFKADDPRLLGTTWIEFDSSTWHETVPSGALILIDEAQKIFRARNMGATPPKYVTELEEHRHRGVDFVMITQHPRLIDPAVRVLTQTHKHMVRVHGFEVSTVHKWESIKEQCDKPSSRKDSEKLRWAFAKDLYGIYKSADEHTIKRTIPARVKLLIGLLIVFIALAAYFVKFMKAKVAGPELSTPATVVGQAPGQVNVDQVMDNRPRSERPVDPLEDIKDYAWRETPRVTGLPHTAPKYDQITVPVRAPVPAMCIQIGSVRSEKGIDCRCWSQQATKMEVEFNMCMQFARDGRFQDFDAERDQQRTDRMAQGEAVMSKHEDVAMGPNHQVISFPSVPDAPRVQGRPMK